MPRKRLTPAMRDMLLSALEAGGETRVNDQQLVGTPSDWWRVPVTHAIWHRTAAALAGQGLMEQSAPAPQAAFRLTLTGEAKAREISR